MVNISPDKYCVLEGFDAVENQPHFYAHDSSIGTLIEIDGVKSIKSAGEYQEDVMIKFGEKIGSLLKTEGHHICISYESSYNIDEELQKWVEPQKRAVRVKNLNLDAVVEENAEILSKRARSEKIQLVVWTRPSAGVFEEVNSEIKANNKKRKKLPAMKSAQDPYLRLPSLEGVHNSFIESVLAAFNETKIAAHVVNVGENGERPDIASIRRGLLYHDTPENWTPESAGTRTFPTVKENSKTNDFSGFFSDNLARQVLPSNVKATGDLRTITISGRSFALVFMKLFPISIRPFNDMLRDLSTFRNKKKMPIRVTWHIESSSNNFMTTLRRVVSGLLGFLSPNNKNIFENLREIFGVYSKDQAAIIRAKVIATTWVEPEENTSELESRRSNLKKAMTQWGDSLVTDCPVNPLQGLVETIPGMTIGSKSLDATIAPMISVAAQLPFHTTAPPYDRGESLFLSVDGKIMPYEAFSDKQAYWLTIINATPGSGKSVLMNRLNYEFACYSRGNTLPYIGVIDVGVSSSGFIDLVKHSLPEDLSHLAYYIRLQNTKEYAINPFDLSLGSRMPIERENKFIQNFLLSLFGYKEEDKAENNLVNTVVKRMYIEKSDLELSSNPNAWQSSIDENLNTSLSNIGFTPRPNKTTWWEIVDKFMEAGQIENAIIAQRYAMPTLADISRVLNNENMKKDHTSETVRIATRAVETAIDRFPIFSTQTRLDIGQARVVSIDLQDVVDRSNTSESKRNNTLMYMIARQAFLSKCSGHKDEISEYKFPKNLSSIYRKYWFDKFDDIQDTKKRLCMDEYHRTGGVETITSQVIADAREGRKWGLEIIAASQQIEDFGQLQGMASTVIFLNAETQEIRQKFRDIFGMSHAVETELIKHVNGPQGSEGANFLVRLMLDDDERWVVMKNLVGARTLWALTTKIEDRAVRDYLISITTFNEALEKLAERFPKGTCIEYYKKVLDQLGSKDEEKVRVPALIAESILTNKF